MEIRNKVLIHNRFDIEVRDSVTNKLKKSVVAYNIVLNQMYTRLCGGSTYFVNIHFGSGTGTLSPTRTSLFSHLGTKTAVDDTLIKSIPLSTWKRKIVLNPEEFVGSTITEVGIAFGSTSTNLVTHSLLKDAEGNTISILKTDVDVVTIYATVFVTFDNSNPNLVYIGMPNSNQLVNYLIGGATAPTGAINVSDCKLARFSLGATATVTWTSDTTNKQRRTNVPRFATTVGNGHIKFLSFPNLFELELPSPSVFTGQSYSGVSLGVGNGVKKEFKIPSANIRNSSLVVKINGVATTLFELQKYFGEFRSNSKFAVTTSQIEYADTSLNGDVIVVGGGAVPYVNTYSFVDGILTRRPDLTEYNAGNCKGVGLSNNGLILAVTNGASPFIYVYDWNGTSWVRRSATFSGLSSYDPMQLSISPNGNVISVLSSGTPFVHTYDWNGTSWVKRPNLDVLPSSVRTIKLCNAGNTIVVGGGASPFIYVYDWNGTSWTKRGNPSILPTGEVRGVMANEIGTVFCAYHLNSPHLTVYDWDGVNFNKRNNPTTTAKSPSTMNPSIAMSQNGRVFVLGSYSGTDDVRSYEYIDTEFIANPFTTPTFFQTSGLSMSKNDKYAIVGSINDFQMRLIEGVEFTIVKFNTAPAVSDVITADYTVDGVHKTDQYVVDVSFAIQFGEGS